MILVAKTYWGGMPFWFRRPPGGRARGSRSCSEPTTFGRFSAACTGRRRHGPSARASASSLIHPRVDFTHHYAVPRLVAAGFGVLAANSRHVRNDTACEHEELVARRRGVREVAAEEGRASRSVVLLGNCGRRIARGASTRPRRSSRRRSVSNARPGERPTRFAAAEMTPADGVALRRGAPRAGARPPPLHRRGGRRRGRPVRHRRPPSTCTTRGTAFASRRPRRRIAPDFVERVRDAQVARVRRIDDAARALLRSHGAAVEESEAPASRQRPFEERQEVLRRRAYEPVMVVHRTMANPAYVDPALDADPEGASRDYGSLLSDRPDLMNMTAMGFARTCTPRAWLSTWSGLSSNADLVANAARFDEPTLVAYAARDREVYFGRDVRPVFDACAASDKRLVRIDGARHYFEPDFGETAAPDVDRLDGRARAVAEGAVRVSGARVVVVYHSEGGRTRALAEAAVRGAQEVPGVSARAVAVSEARAAQDELAAADAIVFGSPTYMGSASAAFKAFMDASAPVWALQGWRDKLAAGFTHSAAPSGDKLGTLLQLSVFAAQHGMVWVGLGLPPSYASETASAGDGTNRLGSHLGRDGAVGARQRRSVRGRSPHVRAPRAPRRRARGAVDARPSDRRVAGRVAGARPPPRGHALAFPPPRPPRAGGLAPDEPPRARGAPGALRASPRRRGPRGRRAARDRDRVRAALLRARQRVRRVRDGASDGRRHRSTASRCARSSPTRARCEDVARYNHRVGDLVLHPLGLAALARTPATAVRAVRLPPGDAAVRAERRVLRLVAGPGREAPAGGDGGARGRREDVRGAASAARPARDGPGRSGRRGARGRRVADAGRAPARARDAPRRVRRGSRVRRRQPAPRLRSAPRRARRDARRDRHRPRPRLRERDARRRGPAAVAGTPSPRRRWRPSRTGRAARSPWLRPGSRSSRSTAAVCRSRSAAAAPSCRATGWRACCSASRCTRRCSATSRRTAASSTTTARVTASGSAFAGEGRCRPARRGDARRRGPLPRRAARGVRRALRRVTPVAHAGSP